MARASTCDCHCRPFPVVEGWHAPAGRRSVNPGLLPRPGRSDRQRRWVPNQAPADEPVSRQPETASSRIAGQARAWPRPYARTHANPRKQGRRLYPHPPCRFGAGDNCAGVPGYRAQIILLWALLLAARTWSWRLARRGRLRCGLVVTGESRQGTAGSREAGYRSVPRPPRGVDGVELIGTRRRGECRN